MVAVVTGRHSREKDGQVPAISDYACLLQPGKPQLPEITGSENTLAFQSLLLESNKIIGEL